MLQSFFSYPPYFPADDEDDAQDDNSSLKVLLILLSLLFVSGFSFYCVLRNFHRTTRRHATANTEAHDDLTDPLSSLRDFHEHQGPVPQGLISDDTMSVLITNGAISVDEEFCANRAALDVEQGGERSFSQAAASLSFFNAVSSLDWFSGWRARRLASPVTSPVLNAALIEDRGVCDGQHSVIDITEVENDSHRDKDMSFRQGNELDDSASVCDDSHSDVQGLSRNPASQDSNLRFTYL